MKRMRLVLAFALLTACSDIPGGDEADAAAFSVCDPPATLPPEATGDGTLPTGNYQVQWSCVGDWCGEDVLLIARADRLTITIDDSENEPTIGTAVWSIENTPLDPETLFVQGSCWFRPPAFGGCFSGFVLCDAAGRASIAHIAQRDPDTGAERVWTMQ